MATKKAATKKAAPGKSMTKWEDKLAALAKTAISTEKNVGGGGNFLGTRNGVLTFDGAEVPGNEMDVVVVDHIVEYVYYGDAYDADNPSGPMAFALGRDEDALVWHENSIPEYAGELCKDSDINQYGSSDRGKGKAAKNMRRLAIIPADQLDDLANAEVAYVKVPVTSVKGWAGYVRNIANTLHRPPLGVITRISLVRDDKTQFKMKFELVDQIEDAEQFEGLIELSERVAEEIEFPYPPYEEPEAKPKGKAGRGKPVQRAATRPSAKPQQRASKAAAPERDSNPAGRPGRGGREPVAAPKGRGKVAAAPAPSKGAKGRKF